jgi:D-serine deaminase-like pyridoxal phosphate-dependent protein
MAANISRVQTYMDAHGLRFRPHIKTHKIPALAAAQVAAGAKGINCQKISEAEVFAAAGFEYILITFNILGPQKLERLSELHENIAGLKVVADSTVTVDGLSAHFADRKPLAVLVECDTGGGRCGVQKPQAASLLAKRIVEAKGLVFGGLVTYPKPQSASDVEAFISQTLVLLRTDGIACRIVSNGGTPSLFEAHLVTSATEHRAGTYIYNDAPWCGWAIALKMIAPCMCFRRSCRGRQPIAPSSMQIPKRLLRIFRDLPISAPSSVTPKPA